MSSGTVVLVRVWVRCSVTVGSIQCYSGYGTVLQWVRYSGDCSDPYSGTVVTVVTRTVVQWWLQWSRYSGGYSCLGTVVFGVINPYSGGFSDTVGLGDRGFHGHEIGCHCVCGFDRENNRQTIWE